MMYIGLILILVGALPVVYYCCIEIMKSKTKCKPLIYILSLCPCIFILGMVLFVVG